MPDAWQDRDLSARHGLAADGAVDQQALVEYRCRAVPEVLGGSPIGEVAARYGISRQSLRGWPRRFELEGMPGLADRSRRPRSSLARLAAD
jgi:transposase